MRFLEPGQGELLKAAVHGSTAVLCALMGIYNGAALVQRVSAGEGTPVTRLTANRHLLLNVAIYAAAFAWEVRQTARHLERLPDEEARHSTDDQARTA